MNLIPGKKHIPGDPDPETLFEELSNSHPGGKKYDNFSRYQDFRQLFLGSEQGKRVLHELFTWGNMYKTSIPKKNEPERDVWVNEGARNYVLKLLAAINAEPSVPRETSQKRRK